MLTGVDLHFEPHRPHGRQLALKLVDELDAVALLLTLRRAKPRVQALLDQIEDRADWPCLLLHQVDVLRVAGRRAEEELVQRRPPSEGQQLARRRRGGEDLHERPGKHEVLLHLGVVHPGRVLLPCDDMGSGDHRSGSTTSLTSRRQRWTRAAPEVGRPGRRDTRRGLRLATQRARGRARSGRSTNSRR